MEKVDEKTAFIVDDINQIREITIEKEILRENHCDKQDHNKKRDIQNDTRLLVKTKEGKTYHIHPNYVHQSEEQAHQEVELWHTRLHKALLKRDLIGCLSIQKEPERKINLSLSPQELEGWKVKDRNNYKLWREQLESRWTTIHEGKLDPEILIRTLRKSLVINDALKNPLSAEFIEIVAGELRLESNKDKAPKVLE